MKASEILVSLGEPMSFPEHLSSPAWPLLASLSAFWLRVSEKLSSLGHRDSVTLRHERARSDRQTHSRKKKGTNQQISQSFIFVQFFSISIFHPFPESQHVSPPPPPHKVYGVRWVIVPNLSAFWWCAVSATRTNTHTQTSCMSFSELCHWILGTVGACQVAVIRPTELHCCLWWHHQTQSLI